MAIRSSFFNSVNGDRRYDASRFAEYFATFIGNGVFPNPSTNLQIMANNDMTVTVRPGTAWINGYIVINDDDYIFQIEPADGVLSRIDRIVVRYDTADREIRLEVKKGNFASSPTPQELQRDADAYELALADILISNGATRIIQGNITDLRLDNNLCGIVHGTVDQVDTTTIFNQYKSWFEEMTGEKLDEYNTWFAQHQQEFLDWFTTIEGILDENVAGNLLLLIQQNESDIKSLIKTKTDVDVLSSGWTLNDITGRYEYVITDADITTDSVVDVNIQLDYLDYARMLMSACVSGDGYVTLYSASTLDNDLVVDYRITKEVV